MSVDAEPVVRLSLAERARRAVDDENLQAALANLNPHAVTKINFHNDLRAPLLLIHGDRDAHIPVEHGHRLAAAAGEGAELWVVPGAPHARSRPTAGWPYVERVTGFFRRHLALEG